MSALEGQQVLGLCCENRAVAQEPRALIIAVGSCCLRGSNLAKGGGWPPFSFSASFPDPGRFSLELFAKRQQRQLHDDSRRHQREPCAQRPDKLVLYSERGVRQSRPRCVAIGPFIERRSRTPCYTRIVRATAETQHLVPRAAVRLYWTEPADAGQRMTDHFYDCPRPPQLLSARDWRSPIARHRLPRRPT